MAMGLPLMKIIGILCVAVGIHLIVKEAPKSEELGFPSNSKLQQVIKLGEGEVKQPEDVAVDTKLGVLYTATRDGWVKRLQLQLQRNETKWENWRHIESDGLLGLTITAAGDLIVCDANKGLLKLKVKVGEEEEEAVELLTAHVDGDPIRFADDVIESSDGMLYFSDASTQCDLHSWHIDLFGETPSGRVLQYDPSTNTTSVLLHNLGFANGVALSQNQDCLLVCETLYHRCLKYWLKGENKGTTEIFIDNLPGKPDNINLAPDGSFWIALLQATPSRWMRFLYTFRPAKILLDAYPKLVQWNIGITKRAMVVNVGSNGNIIRGFDDPTGKVMAFITSALEFDGHLYLGNLHTHFVGKLPLPP